MQIKQQSILKAVVLIVTFTSLYFPIGQLKAAGLQLKVTDFSRLSPSSWAYVLYRVVVVGI